MHPALEAARYTRETEEGQVFSPDGLLEKCDGDEKVFKHALIEAGYIVDAITGMPYKICPICNHKFEDEVGFGNSLG